MAEKERIAKSNGERDWNRDEPSHGIHQPGQPATKSVSSQRCQDAEHKREPASLAA